jgi:hypothetical protein
MSKSRAEIKREIEQRFNAKVRGKCADLTGYHRGHDGATGDWVTRAMGLTVNGRNEPDLDGFEMKIDSAKTTFGDWSPTTCLYSRQGPFTRDEFLSAFGDDPRIPGRFSWSGRVFPQVGKVNMAGQQLVVLPNNDIVALYNYSADTRKAKDNRVPPEFRRDNVELARWEHRTMQERVERKFNKLGWFKCLTDASGAYSHIQFGRPISFDTFIGLVRTGVVFLDCGMHQGNVRPYMSWRATKNIWDELAE